MATPAFPVTIDKVLWTSSYTLEYGAWTVGGVMSFCTLWYMFWPDINWADWVFFLFAATPMTASWITLLATKDSSVAYADGPTSWSATYKAYIRANWYFTFFAWCIAGLQVITQTVILAMALASVGSGEIRFRGGYDYGLDQIGGVSEEFAVRALQSIPTGLFTNFQDVRTFDWANGDATDPNGKGGLIFMIVGAWIAYLCFSYFTLVNYCFYHYSAGNTL